MNQRRLARHAHAALVLPLFLVLGISCPAIPPAILSITFVAGHPQQTIASDVGVTNQIQTQTGLSPQSWTVLTNMMVPQE